MIFNDFSYAFSSIFSIIDLHFQSFLLSFFSFIVMIPFPVLPIVLVALLICLWFWLAYHNESFFFELFDFFLFEVSCLLIRRLWILSFLLLLCSVIFLLNMLRPVRSLLSSTVVIVTTLAIVFSLSSVFSTLSILPSMVFSVIFPCLRPFFRFFSPFFSFFLCFFLFFGWLIANRLLSLRLSLLFWLRFKLAGSWGWSRRLLFFDWISDYNSNFLKMTIMNLLNNRDLIYFSFFVDYILPHYNNLISVCLSIFHFLFNCFFSILSNKST